MGRLDVVPLPIVAVTPEPLKVTAVAPVRFVPESVALTVEPGTPEFGVIEVIEGMSPIWRPLNGVVVPPGVVTVMLRRPLAALAAIEIVTGSAVAVPPVPMVAVTPDPLKVTAVAPARSVPTISPPIIVPGAAEVGAIAEIVGPGLPTT